MTLFASREDQDADSGPLLHWLRHCLLLAGVVILTLAGTLEMKAPQQAVMGIVTVLLAMWVDRGSSSYLATLTLIFVSIGTTLRYAFWRVSTVANILHVPGDRKGWVQGICILALLLAEGYAGVTLLLGYLQTIWPLRRIPVSLPDDPHDWPAVDVMISTAHEPLTVVRYTALAAANIDWPAEKLNVYLLDVGDREEFRHFAEEAGIGYITQSGWEHGTTGSPNAGPPPLFSPFVAIFDADHVPTRSFLQVAMGWFLRDEALGIVQTPQHLYSPDPFDRNLGQFRTVPNEDELFYGIQQDGNDFWNATLFCGSCAVLRRSALEEVGGFAPETLTEDVQTSLRMQGNGWNTAYINIPQAAGLATASLDAYVKQRVQRARGMIQILRRENPLFAKGLSLAQRLCYFHGMAQFLYALPRLIFLTAPLTYLIFGIAILPGSWIAILAFALPHFLLSNITNSRIQGQYRHSFWNDIYETILAPYILIPTLIAWLRPSSRSFEAQSKAGVVANSHFDGKRAIPFLLMSVLQLSGLGIGALRLARDSHQSHHQGDLATIVMYMVWALFNVVILGVCTMVAWESHQRRATARLSMAVPVDVMFEDGTAAEGLTADISSSGVALRLDESLHLRPGEQVSLIFGVLDGEAVLPATVIGTDVGLLRAKFDPLSLDQEEALTMILYSRADTWLGWSDEREADRPLKSLAHILTTAMRGFWRIASAAMEFILPNGSGKFATSAAQLALLGAVFVGLSAAAAQFRSARLRASETKAIPKTAEVGPEGMQSDAFGPGRPAGDELQQLPLPFFVGGLKQTQTVPIVFLSEPSHDALEAAGIVASWIGTKAKDSPVRFPVSFGSIPPGNAIVIVENPGDLLPVWDIDSGVGPHVSLRANPEDASFKVLVISGNSGSEAVAGATRLALHSLPAQRDHGQPLDLQPLLTSGLHDSEAMPDLHSLANSGFPFTRRADLAETAFVLPPRATQEATELYLTWMFRFGAETGRSGVRVTVTDSDGMRGDRTKDYLVFDLAQDQAAMRTLNPGLPVTLDTDGLRAREGTGIFVLPQHAWWKMRSQEEIHSQRLDISSEMPDALIEEAEWPSGSKRSVVVVAARDRGSIADLIAALSLPSRTLDLSGSVSILQNGKFASYSLGERYHTGVVSFRTNARAVLAEFPWILVLTNFAISLLMAIFLRRALRRRAKARFLVSA